MTENPPTPDRQSPPTRAAEPRSAAPRSPWVDLLISYRWPLVLVVLAAAGLLVYLETLRRVDRVGDALGSGLDRVEEVARGFLSGNITESFVSSIPEIDSAGSGNLELATVRATETFTQSDERRVLWDVVSLGVTVTEVKVPVTYRYHLRLDDPWRLEVSDDTCTVWAPAIRATQPPAIHTEGMEKRVDESWLRFDGADQLAALEKSITPRLRVYAQDPRHVALVRDESRRTVAEFVRTWLLMQDQWRSDRLRTITVNFPDEGLGRERLEPTIRLEKEG